MTNNHTSERYARSTRYGANDEMFLEVTAQYGCIHIVRDEDDPEGGSEFLTLDPSQAEALATMLNGAAKHVRAEWAAKKLRDVA